MCIKYTTLHLCCNHYSAYIDYCPLGQQDLGKKPDKCKKFEIKPNTKLGKDKGPDECGKCKNKSSCIIL